MGSIRRLHGLVGMSLAATLTGCHIPANSPFTGLAQLRPVATPHTNVLPPAAMLQHPGPGVEGPGPGIIAPASYEAALEAAGSRIFEQSHVLDYQQTANGYVAHTARGEVHCVLS